MALFQKTIIKQGNGEFPLHKQQIYITFTLKYNDTQTIITQSQTPYRIILGRGDILKPVQQAIKTMKLGESSKLTFNSNLVADNTRFEAGKEIVAQVQIISFGDVKNQVINLTFDERQKQAQYLKIVGNGLIKQKKYEEAGAKYLEAYKLIEYQTSDKCQQLRINLLSNLSLSYLNIKQYQKAIQTCTKVLQQSETNLKILYRRASSYRHLGNFEEAMKDIKQGLRLENNSKQFISLQEQIRRSEKESKKKEKDVYTKMFS